MINAHVFATSRAFCNAGLPLKYYFHAKKLSSGLFSETWQASHRRHYTTLFTRWAVLHVTGKLIKSVEWFSTLLHKVCLPALTQTEKPVTYQLFWFPSFQVYKYKVLFNDMLFQWFQSARETQTTTKHQNKLSRAVKQYRIPKCSAACADALAKSSYLVWIVQTETVLLALPSSLPCLGATNWLSGW